MKFFNYSTGEKYWKNPEKFDPNRFFDSNGKLCVPEAWVPFGLGKILRIFYLIHTCLYS